MRTVQINYTLFGIAELEDEAVEKAYTDWLAKGQEYPYAAFSSNTLEAFCNLFPCRLHVLLLRQSDLPLPFSHQVRGKHGRTFGYPLADIYL